jgi:hypothetical protein
MPTFVGPGRETHLGHRAVERSEAHQSACPSRPLSRRRRSLSCPRSGAFASAHSPPSLRGSVPRAPPHTVPRGLE